MKIARILLVSLVCTLLVISAFSQKPEQIFIEKQLTPQVSACMIGYAYPEAQWVALVKFRGEWLKATSGSEAHELAPDSAIHLVSFVAVFGESPEQTITLTGKTERMEIVLNLEKKTITSEVVLLK